MFWSGLSWDPEKSLNTVSAELEVLPEMTGWELQQQIKEQQLWEDELTRQTTQVEAIVQQVAGEWSNPWGSRSFWEDECNDRLENKHSQMLPSRPAWLVWRDWPHVFDRGWNPKVRNVIERASLAANIWLNWLFPHTVTYIGEGAFKECDFLACVTMPDSVTHIGNFAVKDAALW